MNEISTSLRFADLDNKTEAKDQILQEIASLLDRNDEVNISAIALNDEYKLSIACINYQVSSTDDKVYGSMDIETKRRVTEDVYIHLLRMQQMVYRTTDLIFEEMEN